MHFALEFILRLYKFKNDKSFRFIRRLYNALEANKYDFLKCDHTGRAFIVDYQKLKDNMIFRKTTIATVIKQLNVYSHDIFN